MFVISVILSFYPITVQSRSQKRQARHNHATLRERQYPLGVLDTKKEQGQKRTEYRIIFDWKIQIKLFAQVWYLVAPHVFVKAAKPATSCKLKNKNFFPIKSNFPENVNLSMFLAQQKKLLSKVHWSSLFSGKKGLINCSFCTCFKHL